MEDCVRIVQEHYDSDVQKEWDRLEVKMKYDNMKFKYEFRRWFMECIEISQEDKEKYLEKIKECREMINTEKNRHCTCPKIKCEWHGKCFECVLLHRVNQDHIPCCLQPMLRSKIKDLAKVAEMLTEPKPLTPGEYWDYVNEVCPNPDGK